jgi:hypothetical protein
VHLDRFTIILSRDRFTCKMHYKYANIAGGTNEGKVREALALSSHYLEVADIAHGITRTAGTRPHVKQIRSAIVVSAHVQAMDTLTTFCRSGANKKYKR